MTDANDSFERQVADVATRVVGPERPVNALAVAREAMAAAPRRRLSHLMGVLAGAAAALGLVLAGGFLFQILLVTEETDSLPAISPSPSPTTIPIPSFEFEAMTQIADDRRRFISAARLATGEIAVAGLSRRSDGSAALPAVWTSQDGGGTWTESSLMRSTTGEATDVVASDLGFVAIVRSDTRASEKESAVWTSANGAEWVELAVLPNALLTSIQVTPDGFAAIGVDLRDSEGSDEPDAYPSIWTSADGRAWSMHEISGPWHEPGEKVLLSDDVEGNVADLPLDAARSHDGTWMVTGTDRDVAGDADPVTAIEHPAVWVGSPRGSWSEAATPVTAPSMAGRFDVITWRPEGFIVKGEVRDGSGTTHHRIWATPDGSTWELVADLGTGAPPEVATASDDLIAVIRPPVDWDEGGAIYPALTNHYRQVPDDHPWAMRPDRLLESAPILLSRDGRSWSSSNEPLDGFPIAATFGDDGSFLIVGADTSTCDRWWCAYESNYGALPTVWVAEPVTAPAKGPLPGSEVER